ncbi:hypothetical protein SDC9_110979 [bioreactor metagenome]|uniref:Transposase n=1 Tax=bioreactor metagenome TaxID=1076179 RepID=A0A645BLG4_9ZZZZ
MEKSRWSPRHYSAEFKLGVILDMRDHGLGYEETARKYWPDLTRVEAHNHIKSIHLWERVYLEAGEAGLMEERRGRANGPGKGRPRKISLPENVEEDLIAENQRLRMEIAYLKKLSALVLAAERAKRKKR